MNISFINIVDIFRKHNRIMACEKSNIIIFYIVPLLSGILSSWLFYSDTKAVVDILTLFLSIFIPIFISLLATMISFVMNKIITRHNKERIPLIKETFYNICYLIPISLSLLILSLFMNLSIGKQVLIGSFTLNEILIKGVGIAFYGGVWHIMLNLLMVTKRIFKLFDKEIDLLTTFQNEIGVTNVKESVKKDKYATEGEE